MDETFVRQTEAEMRVARFTVIREDDGIRGMRQDRAATELSLREAQDWCLRRLTFSSGSSAIDGLLGGGFRTGEMVEVYGASTSGKTQLAFQASIMAAGVGAKVTFIDTEGTFRPERLAMLAQSRGLDAEGVLSRVFSRRATTVQEQVSSIDELQTDERIRSSNMIIIDTVSKNFSLEYGGPERMLERQSVLGIYLNRLVIDAYLSDRAVLLTTRVASVGSEGASGEVDIGGGTLRRFAHKILHLERMDDEVVVSLIGQGGIPKKLRCALTERGVE